MASSLLPAALQTSARTAMVFQQLVMSYRIPGLFAPLQIASPFQPRLLPSVVLPLASATFSNLSSFLSTLWDSFLLAVPKKKTPYGSKRSRQLAGKALKDVTSLNHCSACGRVKRMHILCPYCVQNIKDMWAGKLFKRKEAASNPIEPLGQRKQTRSASTELTTTTKKK